MVGYELASAVELTGRLLDIDAGSSDPAVAEGLLPASRTAVAAPAAGLEPGPTDRAGSIEGAAGL
jgi:hypothetical protein